MQKFITTAYILGMAIFSQSMFGQVGINTTTPNATLDIKPKTTDGSKAEGLLIPQLDGDIIKAADTQYKPIHKGIIIYAKSAVTTPSIKTANIDAEGHYIFDGSVWIKLLSQSQNVSTQVLSVSVPGNQNISGSVALTTQFTNETLDVFNAWASNNFTVPANKGGTYTISSQTSNKHTVGGSTWFVMLILQKSTNGGTAWTDLTKDTRSGLTYGDYDNGNLIFWTGTLNAGDKIRLLSACDSSTNNIISIGSLNISKL
jgi:hypothetical protein